MTCTHSRPSSYVALAYFAILPHFSADTTPKECSSHVFVDDSSDRSQVWHTGAVMTRIELLRLLVGQARANGFEFRRWYTGRLGRPWIDAQKAIEDLAAERRYYALLFSHDFASNFWKSGNLMTFQVPQQSFKRRMADGSIGVVKRKAYTRRSAREDVWQYHLQQLAIAEEPLRYMRRYLRVEEDPGAESPGNPKP